MGELSFKDGSDWYLILLQIASLRIRVFSCLSKQILSMTLEMIILIFLVSAIQQ